MTTPAVAFQVLGLRLARRERAALAELYDACSGRAFGLAYRLLGDGPAAEDVVHDAFLWIWENADRINPERGSVEALLLTVTHRRAIDQLRRRRRARVELQGGRPCPEPEAGDEAIAVIAAIDDEAARGRVHSALAGLNAEQREAIELAFFAGMTHREIADARQLPLGTVKSRLRLAMGRLRAALIAEDIR